MASEDTFIDTEPSPQSSAHTSIAEPGSRIGQILGEMRELGMHTEADQLLQTWVEVSEYAPTRSQKIRTRVAFGLVSMQIVAASGIAVLASMLIANPDTPPVHAENTGTACTTEVPALEASSPNDNSPLLINAADTHELPAEPDPALEDQLARSTVQIATSDSLGTGFVMQNATGQNVIITAGHVIEGKSAEEITVITNNGQRLPAETACTIIADDGEFLPSSDIDIDWDIGMLATSSPVDAPPLTLTDEPVRRGESVHTVNYGFPFGYNVGRLSYSTLVTENNGVNIDMIAGLSPNSDAEDTVVASGASGGVITDSDGEVEGVLVTSLNEELYLGSSSLFDEYDLRVTGATVGDGDNDVRPSDAQAMTTNQIAPLLFVDLSELQRDQKPA